MSQCAVKSKAVIYKGADAVFDIVFIDKQNKLVDITAYDDIRVKFGQADGLAMTKDLTSGVQVVAPAANGRITVTLAEADTILLKSGCDLPVEVELKNATDTKIVQFLRAIDVKDRLFS